MTSERVRSCLIENRQKSYRDFIPTLVPRLHEFLKQSPPDSHSTRTGRYCGFRTAVPFPRVPRFMWYPAGGVRLLQQRFRQYRTEIADLQDPEGNWKGRRYTVRS